MKKNIILSNVQITHKIKRIAYQIYEANANEKEIYLAGIVDNGFVMANKIAEEIQKISHLKITTIEVIVNKKDLLSPIKTSLPLSHMKGKSIVLIDDVLNSGGVLMYGVRYFLDIPLRKFLTAVLINRNHKKYPIKADFKGVSLSTTLNETIEVVFEEGNDRAYLT